MSGSVFLNNLDDFIAPSQACVNPLVSANLNKSDNKVDNTSTIFKTGNKKVILVNDVSTTEFNEVAIRPNLIKAITSNTESVKKVATVSLNDCLACRYTYISSSCLDKCIIYNDLYRINQ